MMEEKLDKAIHYLHAELDKLGIFLDHSACLYIMRHLHDMWDNRPLIDKSVNVAQTCRRRYEGDDWSNGND